MPGYHYKRKGLYEGGPSDKAGFGFGNFGDASIFLLNLMRFFYNLFNERFKLKSGIFYNIL